VPPNNKNDEWRVWENVKLPEGKVIVPGAIDSTTNIIERINPTALSQNWGPARSQSS
jgi:methionine synthase II (cobalamin-independent)